MHPKRAENVGFLLVRVFFGGRTGRFQAGTVFFQAGAFFRQLDDKSRLGVSKKIERGAGYRSGLGPKFSTKGSTLNLGVKKFRGTGFGVATN